MGRRVFVACVPQQRSFGRQHRSAVGHAQTSQGLAGRLTTSFVASKQISCQLASPAHWHLRPPPPSSLQVLCGMGQLQALGQRHGLHLQCHTSTSIETTAAVVSSVAQAWLARWQATDPGLHYAVPEVPSEEEAFLTRCGGGSTFSCR